MCIYNAMYRNYAGKNVYPSYTKRSIYLLNVCKYMCECVKNEEYLGNVLSTEYSYFSI